MLVGKIFEKCLFNRLYGFLEVNGLLSINQFGFRNRKNTEMAIQNLIDKIDHSKINLAVYLDIKKAFNIVNYI